MHTHTHTQAAMQQHPEAYESRPEDNYDIGSLRSNDSTDDEEDPRKVIPTWAQKPSLHAALLRQHVSAVSPSSIFPEIEDPNLCDIFPGVVKPRCCSQLPLPTTVVDWCCGT